MNNDIKVELRQTAQMQLPDPMITMAYVEHQLDLIGQIVLDLTDGVELEPEKQARVEMLKELLKHSSIDFSQINHPLQSYKIPKAAEHKKVTRTVQLRYLQAQMRQGVFGS